MAQRTTTGAVRTILGRDYDYRNNPSLQPYIDTATLLVDRVLLCAADKGVTIDSAVAEMMERWMAADYYTKSDPLYKSKSTQGASGSFADRAYREAAVEVDPSGCLNALLKRQTAGTAWLGKAPSEQVDYRQRD